MANVLSLRFPRSVEGWLGWVIVLMLAFFSLMSNEFLSIQNLLDLTESYAVTGIFALGLFVVLVTGGLIFPSPPWRRWFSTWWRPCCSAAP